VKHQFHLLRLVAFLFKVMAILALLVGLLALGFGVVRLLTGLRGGGTFPLWAQVAGAALMFGWGVSEFMVLYAIGEGLNVLMTIEENTRATSMQLVRLRSEASG